MENTHNQRIPSSDANEIRKNEPDIIKGASETDQLDGMKKSAKAHPAENRKDEGTPASVQVNDGSRNKGIDDKH